MWGGWTRKQRPQSQHQDALISIRQSGKTRTEVTRRPTFLQGSIGVEGDKPLLHTLGLGVPVSYTHNLTNTVQVLIVILCFSAVTVPDNLYPHFTGEETKAHVVQ